MGEGEGSSNQEEVKRFRIHIGGLSREIKEESELTSKFVSFGKVSEAVVVKDTVSGVSKGFGYVSLVSTEKEWLKCLSTLNGTKWKGSQLKLELAKETGLERLRKEREGEGEEESAPVETIKKRQYSGVFPAENFTLMTEDQLETRKGWKKVRYGRAVAELKLRTPDGRLLHYDPPLHQHQLKSYAKKEEEIHKELDNIRITNLTWFPTSPPSPSTLETSRPITKPSTTTTISTTRTTPASSTTVPPPPPSAKKPTTAVVEGSKPVSALELKAEQFQASRSIIKAALSNLDKVPNNPNRITFDSDSDGECSSDSGHSSENSASSPITHPTTTTNLKPTRSLFDDTSSEDSEGEDQNQQFLFGEGHEEKDEEEDDTEIGIKKVFEGEKGQHRLNLQRRYGNDTRFKLDDKFMDSDEEGEDSAQDSVTRHQPDEEEQLTIDLAAEKDNALSLLQNVLGHPVDTNDATTSSNFNKKPTGVEWKEMLRYDPDAPDANELLIDKATLLPVSQLRSNLPKDQLIPTIPAQSTSAPLPEVSTDRHFAVSNTIGSIFTKDTEKRDKGSFSLFGQESDEESVDSEPEFLAAPSTAIVTDLAPSTSSQPSTTINSVQSSEPLFFFHFGDKLLSATRKFSGRPIFCRTRDLHDLELELNQKRVRLIRSYKSIHRSAKAKLDHQPRKPFRRN